MRSPAPPRRPGETVHKSVVLPESQKVVRVPFKVFRGMASIGAMVDRLDVEDADSVDVDTLGAEGLEVSVPLRGSARPIIAGMLKHLSSSISYGGAAGLGRAEEDVLGIARKTTSSNCRNRAGASRLNVEKRTVPLYS